MSQFETPPRASDSSYPIALDSREHTLVWVALREHERKLREQASEHASHGHTLTVKLLTRSADRCRVLTDRLDEARFPKAKQEAAHG